MLVSGLEDLYTWLQNTDNEETLGNTQAHKLEQLYQPTNSFKRAIAQSRYRLKHEPTAKIIYHVNSKFLVMNLAELPAASQFGGKVVALVNKENSKVKLTVYNANKR